MRAYCDRLRSQYLVLETPAKYVLDQKSLGESRDFFSSLNLKGFGLFGSTERR